MQTEIKKIFDEYYSPLCNYAAKILADEDLAEDIVQSLFIQLWEKDKITNIKNYQHFLLRATKYKCIDYLRTKRIESNIKIEDISDIIKTEYHQIQEEDIEPLLHYFASKLPPKTREVFLLSRKSKLTYREIAEELNLSIKTVENQMGRALRMMRKLLKENDFLMLVLYL